MLGDVCVVRRWRSVKYEEVDLHDDADDSEADVRLGASFRFDATERPHQALGCRTTTAVDAEPN